MSQKLTCDLCKNPATVHLTQIVDNQIHKVDLCEACAQKKGVTDPEGFSLSDLLIQGPGESVYPSHNDLTCETCGLEQARFKKTGRFGCPDCYATFQPLLKPILREMHSGLEHNGKQPEAMLDRVERSEQIRTLKSRLSEAVSAENYEEAARIRDRLKDLDPHEPVAGDL
ncbi:MAG: UvrB/UvrC motif-containing protein [Opitutales bacterium]